MKCESCGQPGRWRIVHLPEGQRPYLLCDLCVKITKEKVDVEDVPTREDSLK